MLTNRTPLTQWLAVETLARLDLNDLPAAAGFFETYGQGDRGDVEFRGSGLDPFTVVTVKSATLLPVSVQPLVFLKSTLVALSTAVGVVSEQFAPP